MHSPRSHQSLPQPSQLRPAACLFCFSHPHPNSRSAIECQTQKIASHSHRTKNIQANTLHNLGPYTHLLNKGVCTSHSTPLPDASAEKVDRAHDAAWSDSGLVFTTPTGRPLDPTNLTRRFLDRAGLRRIRFHALRHSTAALLLEQGVDLVVIKELLGTPTSTSPPASTPTSDSTSNAEPSTPSAPRTTILATRQPRPSSADVVVSVAVKPPRAPPSHASVVLLACGRLSTRRRPADYRAETLIKLLRLHTRTAP